MARLIRLLDRALTLPVEVLELSTAPSHHLLKVLRAKPGQAVEIFNGSGEFVRGSLAEQSSKKTAVIAVTESGTSSTESPLEITLCIAISKGDRFDYALQKATELGVSRIIPMIAERSEFKLKDERLEKKLLSWQGIVDAAAEQCGRFHSPMVESPLTTALLIPSLGSNFDLKLVLHHRSVSKLQEELSVKNAVLLIGPEGGLSENEIILAEASGFKSVLFGPRVLRTETAPIVALTILQQFYGDFA
ncbi:16S rRNA (uracil(1498)-N(3))-methyltransferase [uncultured Umboniibacter sp.]|uniref:16S rRNA (uracil(1498)-N(3))-methyltransferase n=1 Tax=uncultured Umboniibacter sp. TaxID=1798917 RepID=UPI002628AEF2|nr:16S rRNA (uracil(1498)-N(3))-methyltransferase [uncultured Umboniibacter sp.]